MKLSSIHFRPVNSKKSRFSIFFLSVFFLFSFSVTKYFPGMLVVQDAYTLLIFLYFGAILFFAVLQNKLRFGSLEKYGMVVLLAAPVMAAYASYVEFGQPFIYGYLSQRQFALISATFVFLHLFRTKKFSLFEVESALLFLAWISLIANTLGNMMIDPNLLEEQAGFSSVGMGEGDGKLKLDTAFIIFGFFYYAFSNLQVTSRTRLGCAMLFLSYLIFISGGRFALISVMAAFFFLLFKWSKKSRLIAIYGRLILAGFLFILVLFLFPSNKVDNLQEKFGDAIHVVMTGQESEDVSANARISEVATAEPYVRKNWLWGNGFISNQWSGGFYNVIGYFHPSDIGFYGIIFVFGVFGFLLLSFQFYFIWHYIRALSAKRGLHSRLTDAISGYLVFLAFNSITTGRFAFSFEQGFLFTGVLYCAVKKFKVDIMADERRAR
ncbi:O-antigen ligase family protein [Noviherbaspirillum soli]|uniref:O-antigen ligase family protein n=1 Tax=Noviherbaspirillum soli TaxID=1064518 RepID=UPI00188BF7A3|nr:O-antigen ligase family protein [Noviherbaspirillum soli]